MKRFILSCLILLFCCSLAVAQRPVPIVGGVVTANVFDSNSFSVALTGNVTGVTLVSTSGTSNAAVTPDTGYIVTMKFVQDSVGSRTVAFGGNITTSCTVNATANSVTYCRWQYTASGNTWADAGGGSSGGGGVVGGTFGGSPSSGYTFTSTPIATAPFLGNLLLGCAINNNGTGTYTAGSGYTMATSTAVLAMEYATAGSATSYAAPFTYSTNATWGGQIAAFTATNPTKVQANSASGINALAYTSNTGAGNGLFVCVRYNTGQAGGPITSITDTGLNAWANTGLRAPEAQNKGAGDTNWIELWYALNSAGGADTVTLHGLSAVTGVNMAVGEFSGVATSGIPVDYNYGSATVSSTSFAGATTNTQYTINAVNNATGTIDFTGRDSGLVQRSAAAAKATTGGLLYYKNGIYPGQTAVQESVAGLSNYFIWSLPAPVGTTAVSWHVVCESFTQVLNAVPQTDGCIHTILPSAYAAAQPSNTQLSGWWQRPNATFGSTNNNSDFFVNGTCRIPDNQRTATVCWDTFTTIYSSHIGTVADTSIPITDNICSGLTVALSNITGYRSNQAATDEAYFENTWSVGYNTPYSVLSNHPMGINMHAVCNQNAGNFAVASSLYGGLLIHYQDLHNLNGMTLNCTNVGTRFDLLNTVSEDVLSGSFNRNANATETNPGNCVGHIDVTTGSANGVALTPGNFFSSGGTNFRVNESTRGVQVGMLNSNFTSAATTGTSKQTLATYTFAYITSGAGPTLGPFQNNANAVFQIDAWGITAANGNSKVFELDFGGTAVATITSTASGGSINCSVRIIVSSVANTQVTRGTCDDGATHTVTVLAPGITGSASIVLNAAATTATSSGDFTFKGMTVEYVGGN